MLKVHGQVFSKWQKADTRTDGPRADGNKHQETRDRVAAQQQHQSNKHDLLNLIQVVF